MDYAAKHLGSACRTPQNVAGRARVAACSTQSRHVTACECRRLLAGGGWLCTTPLRDCSATLPVTLNQVPAIALMHPMVRYPSLMRMRVLPVAGNPHVLAAFPPPITTRPNVAALRGWSVRFYSDRRWGYHNRGSSIVAARRRCGRHNASAECERQHGNCYHSGCAAAHRHRHSLRLMVAAIDLW